MTHHTTSADLRLAFSTPIPERFATREGLHRLHDATVSRGYVKAHGLLIRMETELSGVVPDLARLYARRASAPFKDDVGAWPAHATKHEPSGVRPDRRILSDEGWTALRGFVVAGDFARAHRLVARIAAEATGWRLDPTCLAEGTWIVPERSALEVAMDRRDSYRRWLFKDKTPHAWIWRQQRSEIRRMRNRAVRWLSRVTAGAPSPEAMARKLYTRVVTGRLHCTMTRLAYPSEGNGRVLELAPGLDAAKRADSFAWACGSRAIEALGLYNSHDLARAISDELLRRYAAEGVADAAP